MHRTFDQIEVIKGGDRQIDEVNQATGFEKRTDLLDLSQIESTGNHLIGAHTDAKGVIVAYSIAHSLDKHQRGSHTIFQATAKFILALVC